MEAKDLRNKSQDELKALLLEVSREAFNLRMQRAYGHMVAPTKFRELRRDVARIKTVLNQKKSGKA